MYGDSSIQGGALDKVERKKLITNQIALLDKLRHEALHEQTFDIPIRLVLEVRARFLSRGDRAPCPDKMGWDFLALIPF